MIHKFLFALFLLIFISCNSDNNIPKTILSPGKMREVTWQMMKAQVLSQQIAAKDSSTGLPEITKYYSGKVFELTGTDSATFSKSYDWYIKHPDIFKGILDSIYNQQQRAKIYIK